MKIASVDSINVYPAIKLAIIKKAVIVFAIKLTTETNRTINICLELIQFGMSSTLISFDGEYYKYHGEKKEYQWLATGGYESDFLADLVASYIFEKSKTLQNWTTYHGIYQYDGLVVFMGKNIVLQKKLISVISANSGKGGRQPTPPVHHRNMDE